MAEPKIGDRVISKMENGSYQILEIVGLKFVRHRDVASLEDARLVARGDLPAGGRIWYRDHRDAQDHLEPL